MSLSDERLREIALRYWLDETDGFELSGDQFNHPTPDDLRVLNVTACVEAMRRVAAEARDAALDEAMALAREHIRIVAADARDDALEEAAALAMDHSETIVQAKARLQPEPYTLARRIRALKEPKP